MQDLGVVPGGTASWAYGVSADGSVVVGYATTPSDNTHAFRWTQAGGMQDLGVLPGGTNSFARGVSADGSVVVGYSNITGASFRAFRWTQAGGMQDLGVLPGGPGSYASGVSADGSVVVGGGELVGGNSIRALRWTIKEAPATYTPPGNNVEVSSGAILPDGSSTSVGLTFDSVLSAGQTSVTTSSTGAPPPSGFKLGQPPVYYDVTTTATFAGSALVCFNWTEGQFHNESALRLWHMENSIWLDVTNSLNTTTNTICGQVTSLSPFILAEKSYAFTGFFQPLDNLPTVNGVKAGSAIPVKFSLGGYQGMSIFDAGSPRLLPIACEASATVDTIEQTVASSSSGLTYDTASGQYVFVWKTDKSFAGSCKQLLMDFNDGTQKKASFMFTR
jgi:probable HAF family extracellular repeat protein